MGRVEGKVAFITGAGRGQGRSHAIRLAEEGADIIAVDILENIATNEYPMSSPDDLEITVKEVERLGRRIVARKGDVREPADMRAVVDAGLAEFGKIDIVVANAGICPLGDDKPLSAFQDALEVDFNGVVHAISAALPHLKEGASIIATGSLAAYIPGSVDNPALGPGGAGYSLAKRFVGQYMHTLALSLAPRKIRANTVHPTNCNTDLLHNDRMYKIFRPDLENPTAQDCMEAFPAMSAMGVAWVEPVDISNGVLFLASDESRFVTGLQLRIDAGGYLNIHPEP
ncbi:MAG: mycofactocin-coupled SDR family oxidoreductase [Ilumatobacteraceae bacterium]